MDDETKKNVFSLCRVCLCAETEESVSLFSKHEDSLLYNYVNAIANVDIQENDNLPDKICFHCFLELKTAINFKQKCENSTKLLRDQSLVKIKSDKSTLLGCIKTETEYFEVGYDVCEYDRVEKQVPKDATSDEQCSYNPSKTIDLKLECNECGNLFKSKCKIAVHWKRVHFPETLICFICKHAFKTIRALKNHENSKNCKAVLTGVFQIEGVGRNRIFKCKECLYKTKKMGYMIAHTRRHTGEKPFQCNICKLCFTQLSALDSHKEHVHKMYKVEITCQFCGKQYAGRSAIYKHLQSHKEQRVECKICKKLLKNKIYLANHMLRHSGVKNFSCDKCTSFFYTQSELCNHIVKVHDPNGKSKIKKYNCSHCIYKTKSKELLLKHESKHNIGLVPCTTCNLFFESHEKLLVHQTLHVTEKKYSCPVCKQKFALKNSMGNHLRNKHKVYLSALTVAQKSAVVKTERPITKLDENTSREETSNYD